jgi:hypothetical protein
VHRGALRLPSAVGCSGFAGRPCARTPTPQTGGATAGEARICATLFDLTGRGRLVSRMRIRLLPCALRPAPCALRPAPCALRPAPCALRPAPCALRPAPCALMRGCCIVLSGAADAARYCLRCCWPPRAAQQPAAWRRDGRKECAHCRACCSAGKIGDARYQPPCIQASQQAVPPCACAGRGPTKGSHL